MDDVSCAVVGAARICARTYIARAEKRGGGKYIWMYLDRFLCVCNLTCDLAVFMRLSYDRHENLMVSRIKSKRATSTACI